jgi:ElaB/YqjD/DUF883 family membrane-anchored ribosome-binding protein
MESTKKIKDQADTGSQATTSHKANDNPEQSGAQRVTAQVSKAAGDFTKEATQVVDQAKQAATDAYNRASKSLNDGYNQAVDYGRENPGTTMLIAFGAGIGVGLLLAGGFTSPRSSRTSRILPPIMNALTEIAGEVFNR